MDYTKLQMWRVRAYKGFGPNRRLMHSFRVAAETRNGAENKVRDHLDWRDRGEVTVVPAGHTEFFN